MHMLGSSWVWIEYKDDVIEVETDGCILSYLVVCRSLITAIQTLRAISPAPLDRSHT
jgi:hypothetical protein